MTPQPLLCRLGWHRWKAVYRWSNFPTNWDEGARFVGEWMMDPGGQFQRYYQTGHKCTRCGKRRSV